MVGELSVMDHTGDIKLIWDSDKEDEVELARQQFKAAKKKGYAAFSVNKKGDKGEVIYDFDPNAERIIMAPQLQGG